MGNFNRGGNGGGFRGGNVGNRPRFGNGRDGNKREVVMHKVICDECHKPCEVPFRPSSDKPVYCNECFGNKRGDDNRPQRRNFDDRAPKRDFNSRSSQSSFSNRDNSRGDDIKKQLSEVNSKIDRLMVSIEKLSSSKANIPSSVIAPSKPIAKVSESIAKKATSNKPTIAKVDLKKNTKKALIKKAPIKKILSKKGKK